MLGMGVREAQERIDAEEFGRWLAWMEIEPDMGTRADWLAASLAQHLVNVCTAMGAKPHAIGGRLIEWGRRPEDDERALFDALTQRFGDGR